MQTSLVYPRENTLYGILAVLAAIAWLLIVVCTFGVALLYILVFFIAYLFIQSGLIAYLRGTAVQITPDQFPLLHDRLRACAGRLGIREVPDAYLLRHDGIFNAFATKFLGRNYVVLFSDLVDALADRPGALNFYIGHELGHIHRQHLSRGKWLTPVAWLPLIGPAYSRAREYTCDRHGLACCDDPADAAHAVVVLAAGGKHAQSIDVDGYARQRVHTSGFWMSFHELVADYPWLVKRLHAVRELAQGREPNMPARHPLAWLFALITPRSGAGGGGAGVIMMVAIIGMLAAVAIPQFNEYQQLGILKGALAHSHTFEDAIARQANATHAWPASGAEIGLPAHFAESEMELQDDGIVAIHLNQGTLKGKTLVRQAKVENGKVVGWTCSSDDIPEATMHRVCH